MPDTVEVTATGELAIGEDENIHFQDISGGQWTVKPEGVNEIGDFNGYPVLKVERRHIIRSPLGVQTPQRRVEQFVKATPIKKIKKKREGVKMPKSIRCSICGARSPKLGFKGRMAWLRSHRKRKHPRAFKASVRRGVRTRRIRRRRGFAENLMGGR